MSEEERLIRPKVELTYDQLRETQGRYPVPGSDLLDLLDVAETPRELQAVLQEAMSFREGLKYGTSGYDLDSPPQLAYLQRLFITDEDSVQRPRSYYLDPKMEGALSQKVREQEQFRVLPTLWRRKQQKRYEAKGISDQRVLNDLVKNDEQKMKLNSTEKEQLVALQGQMSARAMIDKAFIQRMGTCSDATLAGGLLQRDRTGYPPVTPDKQHWEAFFKGAWGRKVDSVLKEMVRVAYVPDQRNGYPGYIKAGEKSEIPGVKKDIYVRGMDDTEEFKAWMKHMLKEAGGRLDVVWAAWRVGQVWEIFGDYAKSVDDKGNIKIGPPPITNDLFAWLTHFGDKRIIEFGLNAKGERTQVEKHITHTGLPFSIGKFPPLTRNFLKYAKLKVAGRNTTLRNTTLFDIWWGDNGDGLSFADKEFPWTKNDNVLKGSHSGEPPQGTFSGWLLSRARAGGKVVEDVRSRPGLRDLGDPDFFASRVRNWSKVFGKVGKKGDPGYVKPEDNPRMWWFAGIVAYHFGMRGTRVPKPLKYQTTVYSEQINPEKKEGRYAVTGVAWKDIVNHAINCGFLRKEDVDAVVKKTGIKLGLFR